MQELWVIRLEWDEDLPHELTCRWRSYLQGLTFVSAITIPRWLGYSDSVLDVEIHGFADASQLAMATVVYLRVLRDLDDIHVRLVCSKTRVAPPKHVTIPRLELCAAVLLVRLVTQVRKTLRFEEASTHLWTDSTVALLWIRSHPSRWKNYVRNRVSKIQELSNSRWHHVPGDQNPADIVSRGTTP
ncbi:hypothetical protein DMN91_008223 [Ooceraea biroi]|uniref:Uncharacterized protein n=1 Tax=Ooceraea biroi TaxID=2015173 RepID=A0A3L8DH76_OOCBI|nr:hypothetical protein DMN91_008223 [Ooceraea biroi]